MGACRHVIEFLPWYVQGSLGEEESKPLRSHLGECRACRQELAATAEMLGILIEHVDSMELAAYAHDLDDTCTSGARVGAHLVACPSCLAEVSLLRRPDHASRKSTAVVLAAVASLTAAVWLASRTGPDRPGASPPFAPVPEAVAPPQSADAGRLFLDGFESGTVKSWSTELDAKRLGSEIGGQQIGQEDQPPYGGKSR